MNQKKKGEGKVSVTKRTQCNTPAPQWRIDLVTRIGNRFESKSLFFCRLKIVSRFQPVA